MEIKFINGGDYKWQHRTFILVFVNCNDDGIPIWSMLYIERHTKKGMSAPGFQFNDSDCFQFTSDELILEFDAATWILLDGRLRIEKIDKEYSLVEYPIGFLEGI